MAKKTKYDHNKIIKYINDRKCTSEIYHLTGAPAGIVHYLFRKLGKKPLIDKPDEGKIITLHKSGKSTVEISKILEVAVSRVHYVLKKNNLRTPKMGENKRIYHYNLDIFKEINSEEKAYWLGFLYADGYVSKVKNVITLTLAGKDLDHLKKFSDFLKSPYKFRRVVRKSPFSEKILVQNTLTICSCEMVQDLVGKGCIQAKTFKLKFPNSSIVPVDLVHHFIRGYFDGDGSVFISKEVHHRSKEIEGIIHVRIMSTLDMLQGILRETMIGNNSCILKKGNVFDYQIKRNLRCRAMYDYLYRNATIFMDRKKEKFDMYFK